jgi:hypothetical protein
MIPKLIALLESIESSDRLKKWIDFLFSFAFTISSLALLYNVSLETVFRSSSGLNET